MRQGQGRQGQTTGLGCAACHLGISRVRPACLPPVGALSCVPAPPPCPALQQGQGAGLPRAPAAGGAAGSAGLPRRGSRLPAATAAAAPGAAAAASGGPGCLLSATAWAAPPLHHQPALLALSNCRCRYLSPLPTIPPPQQPPRRHFTFQPRHDAKNCRFHLVIRLNSNQSRKEAGTRLKRAEGSGEWKTGKGRVQAGSGCSKEACLPSHVSVPWSTCQTGGW